jgi:TonB-linked outer membrane protein, SusC/RagA family
MKKTILTIVLAMLCLIFSLQSQNQDTITGTIYTQDRKPLPGVTIKIMDTDISTTTDENGKFSLVSKTKKGTVTFSYTGYETQSMDYIMGREDKFKIFMRELRSQLQEVEINAGYYTVKERERTGSISRVSAETIEKQPISNPLQALQGRIPGMEIIQQTGVPGGGFKVQIRGRSSINPAIGNDPLYLIDGVPYPSVKLSSNGADLMTRGVNPLSSINPGDIQSIEILKDADATAIYGSRGANGVVLITTKKGKSGKPAFSARFSQGGSKVDQRLELLNTSQYLQMRQESFKNDGLSPQATDPDANGTWDPARYTDWQQELIGGTSGMTTAEISLNGGNENSSYLISGNYYREGTVFPGNSGFSRGGIHSSLTIGSEADPFRLSFSGGYNHVASKLLSTDLTPYIFLAPNAPDTYTTSGKLNWENNTIYLNPMSFLQQANDAGTDNLVSNLNLSYRIFNQLVFSTSLGYTSTRRNELSKRPLESYPPLFNYTALNRVSFFSDNFNRGWIAEPQLNYKTPLGAAKLDALLGMAFQENTAQFQTIEASGYSSDELMDNIASAALLKTTQTSNTQYRYQALFARLNYNYTDKYFLNITARRDGSSRFGRGKQFANFGAIGAAWLFSEESLVKTALPFLSLGKLRMSYGITGNDQIPDYGYLELWDSSSGTYQGKPTLTPIRIANPDYGWETNRKAEAALQLGFFHDRLNLEIAYYRNRSSNQLTGIPLPLSTAFGSIQANLPAKVQNTGLEFDVNLKLISKPEFQWSANLNLTIPRNKLLSYPGLESSTNAMNYTIGQPLSIRKSYHVYVDSQTGLYTMEDKNGNGIMDQGDRYLDKFIGQNYYGGLQSSFRYKNFNLDLLVSFSSQTGINYMTAQLYSPGLSFINSPLANQPTVVMNRWQQPGDQSSVQKFSTGFDAYIPYLYASSDGGLSITDASYIRLKHVSLSCQLPSRWLSAIGIREAAISLQGQNLFTFSDYIGLDPESQSQSNLPPLRTLTLGIKTTF